MKAVDLSDYQAIAACLQDYLEGARSPSADQMRRAFHPQAAMFGNFGEDFMHTPIEGLFEWHESNGPATDMVAQFAILDVAETTAVVRFEAENWTGHRFTDFLSLVKVEGRWLIVNKIFHKH